MLVAQIMAFFDEIEKIADYRPVEFGDTHAMLDTEIPVIDQLPEHEVADFLRKRIRELPRPSGWTHAQIAIPSSVDLLRAEPSFEESRAAIRLPGEEKGSRTWRAGTLHAHRYGPAWLVHEDKHALSGLSSILHAPEALAALLRRRSAPKPLVEKT